MGSGIYFWEYGPKQAWWWAELRRRHRKWKEPVAVIACMIRLGFCFDLLDPDNSRDLKIYHENYLQTQDELGQPVPVNQRRHKFLDKAVFEFAYSSIEKKDSRIGNSVRVDTCRGIYVRPGRKGRLWKGSWVEHDTFIQILVRNTECILGTWLVEPLTENGNA